MPREVAQLDTTPYRDRFQITDPSTAYLDGNSLGRLPLATAELMQKVISHQWGSTLIGGWNQSWLELPRRLGSKIGSLIGDRIGETIVCDSTSVNLYKLAWGILQQTAGRCKIVTDQSNFPSDLYVLEGLATSIRKELYVESIDVEGATFADIEHRLLRAIDTNTALVCLSHVHYKSGYAYDLAAVTRHAHQKGARVLWDLSHSVGAMPIDLAECQADAAIGCTYKYLNGGPGAPAFLYARSDLQEPLHNPIRGWFGAKSPFEFSKSFVASSTIERFTVGTPPILSIAAIEPGLDITLEAGIEYLRERSLLMTDYLIIQAKRRLLDLGYQIQTPEDPKYRGSHISLGHPRAWQITQALVDRYRVIPDFRAPNTIRFGVAPLYNTLEELEQGIRALESAIVENSYLDYPVERVGVT